jgi:lysozyme family protein
MEPAVEEFYLTVFWNPLSLSEVKDQAVADSIMDMAVNLGAGTAVGKVQMMLNKRWNQALKVDAVIGPKTIEVINSLPATQLNISLFKMRVRHHIKNANPEILVPLIERCMTYLVG